MPNLINTDALGSTLENASKLTQYLLAIAVGVLAFIVVYAVLTRLLGVNPEAGASLTGVVGGLVILALWWIVRNDNRRAASEGNLALVTTNTGRDILVTGLAFGGVIVIGAVIGATPGILIAAGLATMGAWWAGRCVWTDIRKS